MYAALIEQRWHQFRLSADGIRSTFMAAHAGGGAGSGIRAGLVALADHARRSGVGRQIVTVVLITSAILVTTYVAAAALVHGAASHSQTRAQRLMVLQQASVNYRQARATCERIGMVGKDACIAQAHADETRTRAMASLAPQSALAALRSRTDAGIDAAEHDSIVIEPACNVVMRGQLSLCEIQVKSGARVKMAAAATNRRPVHARARSEVPGSRAGAQAGLVQVRHRNAAVLYVRADSQASGLE